MTNTQRYNTIAIILHWVMAIMLGLMIFSGWQMNDMREALLAGESVSIQAVQDGFNSHKSFGLIVLLLAVTRLIWRLTHKAPDLPEGMKPWERIVAQGTHWAFYAIMIGMPLGGWIASSASPFPAFWFNDPSMAIPKLPVPASEDLADNVGWAHGRMAWLLILLVALHVGAAIKHQFINKDGLLGRMIPFLKG